MLAGAFAHEMPVHYLKAGYTGFFYAGCNESRQGITIRMVRYREEGIVRFFTPWSGRQSSRVSKTAICCSSETRTVTRIVARYVKRITFACSQNTGSSVIFLPTNAGSLQNRW